MNPFTLPKTQDYAGKQYLRPVSWWRRRRVDPLDWLTFAIYCVGLALIFRWIP